MNESSEYIYECFEGEGCEECDFEGGFTLTEEEMKFHFELA